MNRKLIFSIFISIIVFIGLVGYNYQVAQKKIKDTKPSPLSISLSSYPEKVFVGQTGNFVWNIDGSSDLSTPFTTIYWGYTATPSALTLKDSPDAVGYPLHLEDYTKGTFKLPDSFDISIKFEKTGTVYFRAYAKVGNNHLWTDEKKIEIVAKN